MKEKTTIQHPSQLSVEEREKLRRGPGIKHRLPLWPKIVVRIHGLIQANRSRRSSKFRRRDRAIIALSQLGHRIIAHNADCECEEVYRLNLQNRSRQSCAIV